MAQPVLFIGRPARATANAAPQDQTIGTVHPLAFKAMQETHSVGTGEARSAEGTLPVAHARTGRGSQRFLQGGLSAPITVTWEITAACNIACVHCLSSSGKRRPRELTTQQSLALVDELAEMQVFQIHFGGGEPFIYPGIWQVLERCSERALVMCISTNGTLITQERAHRLAQFQPLYFQVSLDGGTPETNDRIRGKGVFNRALRGLELLAAENHSLTINSVLTRYSFSELDRLYEIAASFNSKLRVTRLRPSGRGKDVWADVLTADSFFHLNAFGNKLPGLDICGAATATCCICPEGEVYPCAFFQTPEFEAGNLHEHSFKQIWRNSSLFAFYRNMGSGACSGCGQYSVCHGGCPATKWFVQQKLSIRDPECVL